MARTCGEHCGAVRPPLPHEAKRPAHRRGTGHKRNLLPFRHRRGSIVPLPLVGRGQGWGEQVANEFAPSLRKNMTVDERKLWAELRELRRIGFHFRRQAPFGRYILDFVCFSARVVIEVDGVQHTTPEAVARDAVRDAFLRSEGFTVLRFSNGDVTSAMDGVVNEILAALGAVERPPDTWRDWEPPTPDPSPRGGGEKR
jgi:very-short-patch-repair endonuclease